MWRTIATRAFFFASRRRHTRCALVTGVQTCALPIWPRENMETGRPIGLHWFIKTRAAQIRGVSTLVTILKSSGMLDSFDEAYLGAATVNQVLATSISSEASTEAVGQNLAPAVTNSVATQWGLFQQKLDYYSSEIGRA